MYNLTDIAKTSIDKACQYSLGFGGDVGTEFILYGILAIDCRAKFLLNKNGINLENYKSVLIQMTNPIQTNTYEFTPRGKGCLVIANSVAKKVGQPYINTEHLLIAILSQEDCNAVRILSKVFKIDVYDLRNKAIVLVTNTPIKAKKDIPFDTSKYVQLGNCKNRPNPLSEQNYDDELSEDLLQIGYDLTHKAKIGKIGKIIGRDEEIERLIEILCRKTKSSPILIGDAGVGKSAIVEGLALRVANNDVPEELKNKIIYSMDIGGLVAGTKYRGSMEEKLKNIIDIVLKKENIIIFIDEIHTLVQAGGEKGEISPADILKPFLARGEIQIIGATTTNEYRKFIEKDLALERRFQPITILAPNEENCIEIVKGLKNSFENFHKVRLSDNAIISAVRLSNKYIMDRNLPDKAIDLIDEAMSRAKLQKMPQTSLAVMSSSKMQVAKYSDSDLNSRTQMSYEVDEHDIEEVISKWTGIPVSKLTQAESEKLLNLEAILTERVKGQDEAIRVVSKAIRRGRTGISDHKRPIGSFLFLGTTGVGKTELSKAIASALFDDENQIIRFDMSEFMEANSVSKLIGSPPGYVGYEEAGQLTEQVRRKPYSVILFDEIEKAHYDIFNILLQILEDGKLTDSHGKQASFKDSIIVLTSNIGSEKLSKNQFGFGNSLQNSNQEVMQELKQYFKPELINRIDNIVVFNKLSKEILTEIAKSMLVKLRNNLQNKGIGLKFTTACLDYLIRYGTNEDYGARPLRRLITTAIEDELAEMYLRGDIKSQNVVMVDCKNDKLQFLIK